MLDFQLKTQKPLKELVYLELKHKILTGEIPSQTRLMEIELAEKMNVSRTPIREAIRQLSEDGLVKVEARKGAYVANISIKAMLDVFEVREDLEGLTTSLAAQRITEAQKVELRKIADEYEKAILLENKEDVIRLDEQFHNCIVACCNNETLTDLVQYVQELSLRFRYLYYEDVKLYGETAEQHKRILNAIMTGDVELARKEGDQHVKSLKEFVVRLGQRLKHIEE